MSISKSQIRPLLILKALRGRSFTGVSNSEIAKTLNEDPSQTIRALNVLIHVGFVEQLPNGLYALSSEVLNIATSHAKEVHMLNNKIQEING